MFAVQFNWSWQLLRIAATNSRIQPFKSTIRNLNGQPRVCTISLFCLLHNKYMAKHEIVKYGGNKLWILPARFTLDVSPRSFHPAWVTADVSCSRFHIRRFALLGSPGRYTLLGWPMTVQPVRFALHISPRTLYPADFTLFGSPRKLYHPYFSLHVSPVTFPFFWVDYSSLNIFESQLNFEFYIVRNYSTRRKKFRVSMCYFNWFIFI